MASLGYVWNKALGKSIPVFLSTHGPGWVRLTAAIDEQYKTIAFDKVKKAFENEKLFKDDAMKNMESLYITNMSHSSEGDPNPHYSVEGRSAVELKVKAGHVQEDESKQTLCRKKPSFNNLVYWDPGYVELRKPVALEIAPARYIKTIGHLVDLIPYYTPPD